MQTDPFVIQQWPSSEQLPNIRYDLLPDCSGLQFPVDKTCVEILFDRAVKQGWLDKPLLHGVNAQGPFVLTYGEVQSRVEGLAQQLINLGLVSGNRVLLRGSNTVAMAIAWLAIARANLIVVATMPLLRAKELLEICQKGQCQLALCEDILLSELQLTAQRRASLKIVPFAGSGEFDFSSDEIAIASQKANTPKASSNDPVLLAFTSGTTGIPKAAIHTHQDIIAACHAWPAHCLQSQPNDVVLGSPPLAFTFGLGGLLIFPMWTGSSVVLSGKGFTPESMVDAIHQWKVSICYTAPTFYRLMAPYAQAKGTADLRICVSAGEALPLATRLLWKEATGIEILDGIGATEMFHIFISSSAGDVRHGALGRVVPGYEAKVVDDFGNELPYGEIGKLAVRGLTGCKYLDDPRQSIYVKQGWNYPGDAFVQDKDGYFWYHSRADDMIITAGYNVAGPEVESCLLLHSDVAECAVIGIPDDERGMIVKAFIVLAKTRSASHDLTEELQDWVKARLAPYKYPRAIEFVEALPRTETGKLQRFKLRQSPTKKQD